MAHNACPVHGQLGRKPDFGLKDRNEPGRHSVREKRIRAQYDRPHQNIGQTRVLNCQLLKGR